MIFVSWNFISKLLLNVWENSKIRKFWCARNFASDNDEHEFLADSPAKGNVCYLERRNAGRGGENLEGMARRSAEAAAAAGCSPSECISYACVLNSKTLCWIEECAQVLYRVSFVHHCSFSLVYPRSFNSSFIISAHIAPLHSLFTSSPHLFIYIFGFFAVSSALFPGFLVPHTPVHEYR